MEGTYHLLQLLTAVSTTSRGARSYLTDLVVDVFEKKILLFHFNLLLLYVTYRICGGYILPSLTPNDSFTGITHISEKIKAGFTSIVRSF